ncbi:MAG: hypothetical protein RLN75_07060 [Longimicrobiales bacterium]
MTAFPKPEAVPAADPWDNAKERVRTEALQAIVDTVTPDAIAEFAEGDDALMRRAVVTVLVDGADDELAQRARNAVLQACAADPATVVDALEEERVDAIWRRVMTAIVRPDSVGLGNHYRSAGVRRLRATAVLDPSDRKRAAALETLVAVLALPDVDEAERARSPWIPDLLRERLLSDDSNYVRASLATRLATTAGLSDDLRRLGRQWLKHTGITPPALDGDPEWTALAKDPEYFASERRPLQADPRGVRTARSLGRQAEAAAADAEHRRGGPTLVQGHRNQAGPLVRLQQGLALLTALAGVGLGFTGRVGAGAAVGLVIGGLVWAGVVQLWKWYRYG